MHEHATPPTPTADAPVPSEALPIPAALVTARVGDARASEAMLAAILSIAADAIITVDEDQRIMHFNQGAEQIFGWSAAEIAGRPLDLLLPERFRATHPAHVRSFGEGQETARRMGHRREIYGRRKDGEEFPAEASISKLALPDGRTVYSAVLRDITDRKRVEDEQRFLAAASATLAASLDVDATVAAVPRLVVPLLGDWCLLRIVGHDGEIRTVAAPHADPARDADVAELLERYPLDEDSPWIAVDVLRTGRPTLVAPVTDDWLEAHSVDDDHARLLRRIGAAGVVCVPLLAREQVLGVLTLGRGPHGRLPDEADLALARDLALRAALALDNARLYETAQRATAARDVVLGVVSHDLRNPLNAIAMCARALRAPETGGAAALPDTGTLAGTIEESAAWAQRLIRDLLDVAAIEAGQLSLERHPEDPAAIVRRTHATFAARADAVGIALRVEAAPGLVPVHADAERVLQVLANLVANALKFTEAGGEVAVHAERAGREVEFSVADTGAGIPADHLPHLFDLYWHARRAARSRGSGYGLAIARGIVAAHGGRVWVESEVGAGSTFRFTIPVG